MRFLLPTGIGDTVWALHKINAVATAQGDGIVEVFVSGGPSELETRALDFVRRFRFVKSVAMRPYYIHTDPPVSPEGYYNYLADGWYNFDYYGRPEKVCALMPNGPLERGIRLESWLPQYPIDWGIFRDFRIDVREHDWADLTAASLGPFCIFYLGPLRGNTTDGHNRGPLWTPQNWLDLGRRIHRELGLNIAVVGASYDLHYYEKCVEPCLDGDFRYWTSFIGEASIGQLYALAQQSRFVVSYQSGVGIVSAYLGVPTAIWWRARGDSISQQTFLSFDEGMASAWAPPDSLESGRYFPMIYRRQGVDSIVEWATRWST